MLSLQRNLAIKITNIQLAFTCPKPTTERPEQGNNHTYSHECQIYIYALSENVKLQFIQEDIFSVRLKTFCLYI